MTPSEPALAIAEPPPPPPAPKPAPAPVDPRLANAATSARGFALLALQLLPFVLLTWWFPLFREHRPTIFMMVGGFCVHYWLPFRHKEPFWLALCLAGMFVVFKPTTAAVVIAYAGLLFAIVACPVAFRFRVVGVVAVFGATLWAASRYRHLIPTWRLFIALGALIWFRMVVYLYDLKHAKNPPSFREFVRYFFILPNFQFVNFPVVDFQMMRTTYYQRNIHLIAQQGILWMALGTFQLLINYSVFRGNFMIRPGETILLFLHAPPGSEHSVFAVFLRLAIAVARYLRTQGSFWLCIGMLHLFGYDLPRVYNYLFLSRSPMDLFRRGNIYWKDAMMKVVYVPVYFRFRKRSDFGAKVLAILAVFAASWFMHIWLFDAVFQDMRVTLYQAVLIRKQDALLWGIFGVATALNLVVEHRAEARARAERIASKGVRIPPTRRAVILQSVRGVAQNVGLVLFMTTLWTLEWAPSIGSWIDGLRLW